MENKLTEPTGIDWDHLSLAEVMRLKIHALLDRLGPHHAPDLYNRVMGEVERVLIEEALSKSKGHLNEASKSLDIHRNTLRLRMRSLDIPRRRGA